MTEATLLNRLKRFGYGQHHGPMAKACAEAAIEIERMRDALTRIANQDYDSMTGDFTKWPCQIAADALRVHAKGE